MRTAGWSFPLSASHRLVDSLGEMCFEHPSNTSEEVTRMVTQRTFEADTEFHANSTARLAAGLLFAATSRGDLRAVGPCPSRNRISRGRSDSASVAGDQRRGRNRRHRAEARAALAGCSDRADGTHRLEYSVSWNR